MIWHTNIISISVYISTIFKQNTNVKIVTRILSMKINISIRIISSTNIHIGISTLLLLVVVLVFVTVLLVFVLLKRYVVCPCYTCWEEGYF